MAKPAEEPGKMEDFERRHGVDPDSALVAAREILESSGKSFTWMKYEGERPPHIKVELPDSLEFDITEENAQMMLAHSFTSWRSVAGMPGIVDMSDKTLHCLVKSNDTVLPRVAESIGFVSKPDLGGFNTRILDLGDAALGLKIRLCTVDLDQKIQLALRVHPNTSDYSLQVSPVAPTNAGEAADILTSVASSLFFEIENRSGLHFSLKAPEHSNRRQYFDKAPGLPAHFPRQRYDPDGLALYNYACERDREKIRQMPAVIFLAYYQVLEHFMPAYSKESAMRKFRLLLKDPRFDADDDLRLGQLVSAAAQFGRDDSERSQLRAAISGCTLEDEFVEFIASTPDLAKSLSDKHHITNVATVNPKDKTKSLLDQVADRVYDIRCRIVHSKSSINSDFGSPLTPVGPEARRLGHDIEIARFFAQKVVAASARPFSAWKSAYEPHEIAEASTSKSTKSANDR